MLVGVVAGAALGLRFHGEAWLGGYGSWKRRMLRLGHVSFFGLGLLNIAFALTAQALDLKVGLAGASGLLLVGAVSMPAVCGVSAFWPAARHAFFVPVGSVGIAAALFLVALARA